MIEVLLSTLLAHNQVCKRRLTDGYLFKLLVLLLEIRLRTPFFGLNIGLELTLLGRHLAKEGQLLQLGDHVGGVTRLNRCNSGLPAGELINQSDYRIKLL